MYKFLALCQSSLWTGLYLSLAVLPLAAQLPPPLDTNAPNIDEVPDDPQQLRTWRCNHGNRAIAVEAKDVAWRSAIETDGWQCLEELSYIPANKPQFSCEPDESTLGLLTVTWLTGKDGKAQMQAWMDDFSASTNQICTVDTTNPFWK